MVSLLMFDKTVLLQRTVAGCLSLPFLVVTNQIRSVIIGRGPYNEDLATNIQHQLAGQMGNGKIYQDVNPFLFIYL